jgi:hypothetical protein
LKLLKAVRQQMASVKLLSTTLRATVIPVRSNAVAPAKNPAAEAAEAAVAMVQTVLQDQEDVNRWIQ